MVQPNEIFLRALLNKAPIVLFATDAKGTITLSEGGLLKPLGRESGESVGKSVFQQFAEVPWIMASTRRVLAGEEHTAIGELHGLWTEARFTPLVDPMGGITGMVGFAIDISPIKKREVELIRSRDEVLSVASHDLKTPVTALRSLTELMSKIIREEALPASPRVVGLIERSLKETEHLVRAIDELLDVSRIRSGQWELTYEPLDLAALICEVSERVLSCGSANSEVRLDLDEKICGEWDRLKVEQIILNLITNAQKFGSGKPILVWARDLGSFVQLVVEDQGPGIEVAEQQKIFECFNRGSKGRIKGGLGLGLYIVKQAVEAHRGTVHCVSKAGSGARFVVQLPKSCGLKEAVGA